MVVCAISRFIMLTYKAMSMSIRIPGVAVRRAAITTRFMIQEFGFIV